MPLRSRRFDHLCEVLHDQRRSAWPRPTREAHRPSRSAFHRLLPRTSEPRACLTAACEIPNCLAMAEGFTPALNAARTAFVFPTANEGAALLARVCVERSNGGSVSIGLAVVVLESSGRPRRLASLVTVASSMSISLSSSRVSAPAKSVGKR